jgi:hypothetical protein
MPSLHFSTTPHRITTYPHEHNKLKVSSAQPEPIHYLTVFMHPWTGVPLKFQNTILRCYYNMNMATVNIYSKTSLIQNAWVLNFEL